jgi:glycosyltransferase involved in cell wall biosynthesis
MNVLLATHGRPELLGRTLESLLAACSAAHVTKIVVVENGGDFGAKGIIAKHNRDDLITFMSVSRGNKSAALNEGLSLCEDGLVFLTDDDVTIPANVLVCYDTISKTHGPGWFFGGPTKPIYACEPEPWIKPFLPFSARGWSTANTVLGNGEFFLGFNWAAYRSDLMAAGAFNPDYGPGSPTGATGQETEMQRRLRERLGAQGYYLKDALVSHVVAQAAVSAEWLIRRVYRNGVETGLREGVLDIAAAEKDLAKLRRRARLRGLAAAILGGNARRFRHAYHNSRTDGLEHGLTLVRSGKTEFKT